MDEMTHIHEMIPILYQWLLANYTSVRVPLPWMKWNTSLNYNYRQSIQVVNDLLSPKLYILLFRGSEIFILIHNSQGLRL